jgi:hypothetical protein
LGLKPADFVAVFRLARQPGPVHAGPLGEVQDPSLVLRLFTLGVSREENLLANAVFALEGKHFFLQRVDVCQQFLSPHKPGTVYLTSESVGRITFDLEDGEIRARRREGGTSKAQMHIRRNAGTRQGHCSGAELLQRTRPPARVPPRTLDQVIVQLRKKLGDNGDDPKHLLAVHGVGYKLML